MNEQVNRLDTTWHALKACLERERERVHAEIRAYPTPIPRCDQQFNHLIERRERLFRELARLDQAAAAEDGVERLVRFIDSSDCLDPDLKRRFRSALSEGVVKPELS
jgi:hypothetical protein